MNELKKFLAKINFSDSDSIKYIISRNNYYEAKEEIEDLQKEYNEDGVFITSFHIVEIKT